MSGRIEIAWQAASAASGALVLFDQAVAELEQLAKPPAMATSR
jgi:hypothetical protein